MYVSESFENGILFSTEYESLRATQSTNQLRSFLSKKLIQISFMCELYVSNPHSGLMCQAYVSLLCANSMWQTCQFNVNNNNKCHIAVNVLNLCFIAMWKK